MFLSKDPWPGSQRQPQSLNAYTYVLNRPTCLVDPRGEWPPTGEDIQVYRPPAPTLATDPYLGEPWNLPLLRSNISFEEWDRNALDALLQSVLIQARNLVDRKVDWNSNECIDITDPGVPLACIDVPILAAIRAGADIRSEMTRQYNSNPSSYKPGQNPADCFFTRRIHNVVNYLQRMGLYQEKFDPNPKFQPKPGMFVAFDGVHGLFYRSVKNHSGIVSSVVNGEIQRVICAVGTDEEGNSVPGGYKVKEIDLGSASTFEVHGWAYFPHVSH